jgi:nuclear cap-binding protein subunit 1
MTIEDAAMIKAWGKRWQVVFLRKMQVEETLVGEEAVEARVKMLPVRVEELEPQVKEPETGSGATEDVHADDVDME